MRCPYCHQVISKEVEFCPYCGKKILNNSNFNQPHQTNLNNITQTTNPHKITKKAKLLLAGIFAVVVIGGATVHHIHYNNYIHSPQSVDLSKALNNHIVNSSTIDGHNYAINNLISSSSDGLNGSEQ